MARCCSRPEPWPASPSTRTPGRPGRPRCHLEPFAGAAAPYGLAGLAGRCGTVGVTGYTLGGGQSWLSRTFGFAADSVTSAELITADGAT